MFKSIQNSGEIIRIGHVSIISASTGTEGRTPYRKLEKKLKTAFATGAKTTFSILDKNVGEFMCAKIYKMAKGPKSDWFVEYIILTTPYNNKCYTLPCYRWFTDDSPILIFREGIGMLNQFDTT